MREWEREVVKVKKRLHKKYLSRASRGIKSGTITPFYAKRAREIVQYHFQVKYLTEFRMQVYELESPFDFVAQYGKHVRYCATRFEQKYGIDVKALAAYTNTLPRCRKGRTRKKKLPEYAHHTRKIRKPETFTIRTNVGKLEVVGERCFIYNGYEFMVHRDGPSEWMVSCKTSGLRVAFDTSYKRVVKRAKELLEKQFETCEKRIRECILEGA